MTEDERKAAFVRFDKLMDKLNIKWDDELRDENCRIYPEEVRSDFEIQIKKEIDAWIRKQPAEMSWTTPAESAKQYWAERLK
jgi:hypothetical protein